MDLQTAVAASMLPTSRATVAAAFKQLRHEDGSGAPFLEFLWAAAGRADVFDPAVLRRVLDSAARVLEAGPLRGIHPIAIFDPRYPPLLGCIADPPPVLWARGNLEVLTRPAVAIVGSRAATSYAIQVGTRLGSELGERGILVVSGLARGVDSAAHRGCLRSGGPTVAVQGCGLDRVYPPEHDELASAIVGNGLSLATVVVEASEQSGSLITARCALEQGRDVMAVPGSVLSGRNRGSHALLKDGAKVVETADDILQELGWTSAVRSTSLRKSVSADPLLTHMEPGEPYELGELAVATGVQGARLLARLTELELAGLVSTSCGRYFRHAAPG